MKLAITKMMGMRMGSTLFNQADPEKVCLEGFENLLLHEKELLRQILDQYTPETMPEQLVIPLNEIKTLCNSSLSGLKLPELMIRDTLRKISAALSDHAIFSNKEEAMNTHPLVQKLKVITNLYVAISNADRELALLKSEHKITSLSAHHLQQRVASIGRNLEAGLKKNNTNFADHSEQQHLSQAMINSVQSFQRYAVSKIPPDKQLTTSTVADASTGMSC